jgi:hypothetical protein
LRMMRAFRPHTCASATGSGKLSRWQWIRTLGHFGKKPLTHR